VDDRRQALQRHGVVADRLAIAAGIPISKFKERHDDGVTMVVGRPVDSPENALASSDGSRTSTATR
jgi:hypothetical protein